MLEKISPLIEKYRKLQPTILKWYIMLYPLCDMLYTVYVMSGINLPVNPNQIIRFLGLVFMITFITNWSDFYKVCILGFWLICSFFIQFSIGNAYEPMSNISLAIKIANAAVFMYAFYGIIKNKILEIEELEKCILVSALIAITSVLLSYFGLGLTSYAANNGRWGYKGLFLVQTTIAAFLIIILPLFLLRKGKRGIIGFLLCAFALVTIGSKTSVLGTIAVAFVVLVYNVFFVPQFRAFIKKHKLKVIVATVVCGTVGLVMLGIYIYSLVKLYHRFSFYSTLSSFILSNRESQLYEIIEYVQSFLGSIEMVLGAIIGYGYSYTQHMMLFSTQITMEHIELDLYGLFFYAGAPVLIYFLCKFSKAFVNAVKQLFICKFSDFRLFIYTLAFGVGFVYATLGGHVMYEALTQLPFYYIVAYLLCRATKE